MSFDCTMTLRLWQRKLSWGDILRVLLQNGWSLSTGDGRFSVSWENENGELFDWTGVAADDSESVLTKCVEEDRRGRAVGIQIVLTARNETCTVLMWPKTDEVVLELESERAVVAGAEPFTDHTIYVRAFVQPLLKAGCQWASLEWRETP